MTDYEIISILHDIRDCKHVNAQYSDIQYKMAIEYAINKIRSYHDLLHHYTTLAKEYADVKAKHEIPLRDNY